MGRLYSCDLQLFCVGFNSMPNLIVILFNLMYPIFYVGFHCMGYVWERVWRLKATLKIKGVLAGSSWEIFPRSEAMCSTHDWNAKSHDRWWQLLFASKAFSWDTHKTFCFAILSYLIHHLFTHTIYFHITHILKGVLFREKTLATTFES